MPKEGNCILNQAPAEEHKNHVERYFYGLGERPEVVKKSGRHKRSVFFWQYFCLVLIPGQSKGRFSCIESEWLPEIILY